MKKTIAILAICFLAGLAIPQTMHTPSLVIGTPPEPEPPAETGVFGSDSGVFGSDSGIF